MSFKTKNHGMEITETRLNDRALRLSYFTVVYNVLEDVASLAFCSKKDARQ